MKVKVLWITGLSGAGKTTLARLLTARLKLKGTTTLMLDGDHLREVLSAVSGDGENHNRATRVELGLRYARLCGLLASQDVTVVISTISMFREVFSWNRSNLPGYFEVYLKAPMHILKERDPKSIYRRFECGQIKNVAGLDLIVDEPQYPDCLIDLEKPLSAEEIADLVMSAICETECA